MFKIHHYAVEVANPVEVCQFYREILGFEIEPRVDMEGEKLIFLKLGEFRLEIFQNGLSQSISNHVHLCFQTISLQESMKKFADAGLKVDEGPYFLKNGWKSVFYKGLANEVIEIIEVQKSHSF